MFNNQNNYVKWEYSLLMYVKNATFYHVYIFKHSFFLICLADEKS